MKCEMELIPGLPRKELIERIYFHHRRGEVSERALGFYLLDMKRRREQGAGFRRAAQWALEKIGLDRAHKLILAAQRMEKLPEVSGAFSRGEISWTKVRAMIRVATPETERQWIEFAKVRSCREVEKAASRASPGKPPGSALGISRPTRLVRFPLAAERHARWEMAIRKVCHEQGRGTTPADAAVYMAELVLGTEPEPEGGDGASKVPARRERGDPHFVVVYHVGPDGKSAWMDTSDGRVEVDPGTLQERLRAGAKRIQVKDVAPGSVTHAAGDSGGLSQAAGDSGGARVLRAIRFGERGSVPKDQRDKPVSAEMRSAVLARDGFCCVVCRRRRDIEVHHEPLADGGLSEMECCASLCDPCHGALHEQELLLRIEVDGTVTALDKDGNELGRQESAAEVLADAGEDCPLETIVVREAAGEASAPAEARQGFPASLDDLPSELTAAQWRQLESRLEWSPAHGAFLLRPEGDEIGWEIGEEIDGVESTEKPAGSAPAVSPARPRSFEDFVGQKRVVENLLLAAKAAAARGEPLGHVLLSGPAGLGKTTIARLLAESCGSSFQEVVAGNIADPHQLISILARMEEGSFVFIDEIHALRSTCAELLYPALEDGVVQVVVRQGGRTRLLRVRLEPFTLLGATTRLGALSEPFRGRFRLKERLEPYGEEELAEIVARAAARLAAPVTFEAARDVATMSRGTPREAIQLLDRARDIAQVSETAQVSGASQDHGMSQADGDSGAVLVPGDQESSLSHDGVKCGNIKIVLMPKKSGDTYGNGEAAAKVDPPAKPSLRQVHVVHAAHVREAAQRAGLDDRGLSREDRAVVRLLLERDAPMGLEAIASRLGLELQTLRDVHEPWLERAGLVERTVHGRVATERARAWYGGLLSQTPPGPVDTANAEKGGGQDENQGQDGHAGPNGGRRSIPILRLPCRFG